MMVLKKPNPPTMKPTMKNKEEDTYYGNRKKEHRAGPR